MEDRQPPPVPRSSDRHREGGLTATTKETLWRPAPGLSLCHTYRVAPAAEADYLGTFQEINRFGSNWPDCSWSFLRIADPMLVGLFDDKALNGVHAGWSGKAFSSTGFFLPE